MVLKCIFYTIPLQMSFAVILQKNEFLCFHAVMHIFIKKGTSEQQFVTFHSTVRFKEFWRSRSWISNIKRYSSTLEKEIAFKEFSRSLWSCTNPEIISFLQEFSMIWEQISLPCSSIKTTSTKKIFHTIHTKPKHVRNSVENLFCLLQMWPAKRHGLLLHRRLENKTQLRQ